MSAARYKEWNVVFVKNDWCWHNEPSQSAHLTAFNAMRDALNAISLAELIDPSQLFPLPEQDLAPAEELPVSVR